MKVERISYSAGGKTFVGALVYDDTVSAKRPLMLVAPNWLGVTDEAIERTGRMIGSRYVGFVADMYGDGKISAGPPEAADLANGLRAHPAERRLRIKAAFDAMTTEAGKRNIGDVTKRVAVGFCFGGGNVLELARAGADLQATICLHGDLTTNAGAPAPGQIKSPIFVLHGSADPAADKTQRDAFEAEMDSIKARWQMIVFGGVLHSFCEEGTDVPGIAKYDPAAARQAYRLLDQFITDALDKKL